MSKLAKILRGRAGAIVLVYVVGCLLGLAMYHLTNWINTEPFVRPPDELSALDKAAEAYQSVNSLLTTLATGLLGALGFLLINRPGQKFNSWDFWWAATTAMFACVSLYWGYVSSQNVQWVLEFQWPTLDIPILQKPRQFQFISMVLGVICVAHFAMRTLIGMGRHEGEKNAWDV